MNDESNNENKNDHKILADPDNPYWHVTHLMEC